jgi:uncharacterized protein RhaS with RHS repeats
MARYYDPLTSRFISRDPFPGWFTKPLSLNRYAYTLNNPANFIDPSGLSSTQLQLASMTSVLDDTWVWLKETIKFFCPVCSGAAGVQKTIKAKNEAKQSAEGQIKKFDDIYSNVTPNTPQDTAFKEAVYEAAMAGAIPPEYKDTPWKQLPDVQKTAVINKGVLGSQLVPGFGTNSDVYIKYTLQPALKP